MAAVEELAMAKDAVETHEATAREASFGQTVAHARAERLALELAALEEERAALREVRLQLQAGLERAHVREEQLVRDLDDLRARELRAEARLATSVERGEAYAERIEALEAMLSARQLA